MLYNLYVYKLYMYTCMLHVCMHVYMLYICMYISCICMYVYICACLYMHEIYSICATSALTSGLNEHGNPMNRINLDKYRKKCER